MSYLVHGAYSVFLIFWIIWQVAKAIYQRAKRAFHGQCTRSNSPNNSEGDMQPEDDDDEKENWLSDVKLHALPTLVYSLLTFVVIYTWYLSLPITYISVNTAIYNSACVFVFLFSVLLLKESVSLLKILSVLICVSGIVMLCIDSLEHRSEDEKNNIWGCVLVIISTILFALYEVLLKRWGALREKEVTEKVTKEDSEEASEVDSEHFKHESVKDVLRKNLHVIEHSFLFTGLIGFFTLALTWPGIFLVDLLGYETFELPQGNALYIVLIMMALDSLSNFVLLIGIALSSPLFISVGALSSIPATVVADYIAHGTVLPPLSYFGILSIVLGFLLLSLSEYLHSRISRRKLLDACEEHTPLQRWILVY